MAPTNNSNLIRVNKLTSNKATRRMLDSQEHVVVPVTLLKEGLLNGIFYNSAEFGRFAQTWNGVPVPVQHPQKNGSFVSANSPEFEQSINIGRIYNVTLDADALKGEVWINVDKATRLGFSWIIDHFDKGEVMEVSTGLFPDIKQVTGIWNNTPYNYEAVNLRPDHLALLPDEIGACSVADGCGAMRANKAEKITVNELVVDAVSGTVTLGDSVDVVRKVTYEPRIISNISTNMCEKNKEDNALSANERAELEKFRAAETLRVNALRESVGAIHKQLTPAILANMSVDALEALNVAPVTVAPVTVAPVTVAPAADMSGRGGVSLNTNQQPYQRPSILLGDW